MFFFQGVVGSCPNDATWTPWSSENNPYDFEIDYERRGSLNGYGAYFTGYSTPFALQARVVDTHVPFTHTDDKLKRIGPDYGLVCFNNFQEDGQCEDYEIRYCVYDGRLIIGLLQ